MFLIIVIVIVIILNLYSPISIAIQQRFTMILK